ncbi:MAG: IS91 family transposase, partial [Gammaproteobacteria bacterium]|nr:IS91 family transposase [Gammaproteobacteria bacterium]
TMAGVSEDRGNSQAAKESGFSLHAGVMAYPWERKKLERLCRYITRPAIAENRLSLTPSGQVRYQLNTPYRDGPTHVVLAPLDFRPTLPALAPQPRVNFTPSHGVFAAHSRFRSEVTPARTGRQGKPEQIPAERRRAMSWAQRLKRVFSIDVEVCKHCGGRVKVLACIEDQP